MAVSVGQVYCVDESVQELFKSFGKRDVTAKELRGQNKLQGHIDIFQIFKFFSHREDIVRCTSTAWFCFSNMKDVSNLNANMHCWPLLM